jgi:iron complex outermembrane receptor protein
LGRLFGVRGLMRGWRWDLSSVYGGNGFAFSVHNSNNVTLGNASPTDFEAGKLKLGQWTNNLDFSKQVSIGLSAPLSIGVGAEVVGVRRWVVAAG